MRLDISCPIELRGYALTYSSDTVHASVRLHNLSTVRIESFEGVATWKSSISSQSIACPFFIDRLHANGESNFQIELSTERPSDADELNLTFTLVRFEDDSPEWQANDGPFVEISPLPTLPREALVQLQTVAGKDAVCYPSQETRTWTCVCGRINLNSQGRCVRCHRGHFTAISYTPERIRFQIESNEISRSNTASEEVVHRLRDQFLRQHAQTIRRTAAILVGALVLAIFLVLYV